VQRYVARHIAHYRWQRAAQRGAAVVETGLNLRRFDTVAAWCDRQTTPQLIATYADAL